MQPSNPVEVDLVSQDSKLLFTDQDLHIAKGEEDIGYCAGYVGELMIVDAKYISTQIKPSFYQMQ